MPDKNQATTRPQEARLTSDYAARRADRISGLRYRLRFSLEDSDESFSGDVEISFRLADTDAPVTIDFTDGRVDRLMVNGATLAPDYDGNFIELPAAALAAGENHVAIEFGHGYSRSGQGLHRFRDPQDGRIYVHSHFEPYDANRLFPCFDQPDLKAIFELEVSAPAAWKVISATREREIVADGTRKTWRFPATRPISTYIFPLHAGEYRVWGSRAGDITLRLFARESLAEHVRAEDWFDLTRRGFAFFEDYFGLPYPYGKYDQLIVPEFNIGGMENVAAVTYTESFVRRGRYTREDMERLTNTLLHEMSHMWFGDLVTPRWWDGLWLKEAFATYMGYLAQAEATPYTDAWHLFYVGAKQRAYKADQRVTTHPIQVPVDDTHYAFANFDDITYRKGSSVLTQLSHFVGQDAFRDGVRAYLRAFADGATTLDDFIAALEQAAGVSLEGWVEDWLATPGVNSLESILDCADGQIRSLTITQRAPGDYPRLREHRVQVGLYRWDDGRFNVDVLPVTVSGERTEVHNAIGRPCPELVYPNHGDWSFAIVALDPADLRALPEQLPRISEPLQRSMYWASLWEMVTNGTLALDAFLTTILTALPGETNDKVIRQVTGQIQEALGYVWRLPEDQRSRLETVGPGLEDLVWREATGAPAGSDIQALWTDTYRRIAHTPDALARLAGFLDGDGVPAGYIADQDRRWLLLRRLAGFPAAALSRAGAGDIDARLDAERQRDPSDSGQTAALGVAAARPELETKREWLQRIRDPDSDLSLHRRRSVMAALFPDQQARLHAALEPDLLDALPRLGATHQDPFLTSYGSLIPWDCRPEGVARLTRAIAEQEELHPILLKALRVARQEAERCGRVAARLSTPTAGPSAP
jgi:aminopeptidase N